MNKHSIIDDHGCLSVGKLYKVHNWCRTDLRSDPANRSRADPRIPANSDSHQTRVSALFRGNILEVGEDTTIHIGTMNFQMDLTPNHHLVLNIPSMLRLLPT